MTPLLQPNPQGQRATRRARRSVVLTAVALVAIGFYLGWKEGYFTPVAHFHFEAQSSKSLGKGMAVHLSGFKIGQVSSVELQLDRKVLVDIAIYRQYLGFIKTDSEVRLEAGMPIGDPALEITGGPSRADVAGPGTELHFHEQPQLFDQLASVVDQIKPTIANFNNLLTQMRQPQGDLQTAMRNLVDTTTRIQAWTPGFIQRSDATLASFKQAGGLATATLSPLMQNDGDLQSSLRNLHATTDELRTALPPLLENLKALSASLRASAVSLEPSVSQIAPKIPALVDESRRTAAGAGEVVEAVKELPLIRDKINQTETQPLLPTAPP